MVSPSDYADINHGAGAIARLGAQEIKNFLNEFALGNETCDREVN
jgi:hypothetical protein